MIRLSKFRRNVRNYIKQTRLIINADHINAHYLNIPVKENRVNIYEYHPELLGYNDKLYQQVPYNLGDSLGEVIIRFLLEKRHIDIDAPIPVKKHLNCVGSNIFCSYQNATIWGSGIMNNPNRTEAFFQRLSHRKLDIRAVRGPLTKGVLERFGHDCPEVYGDPAILMPMIYHPYHIKRQRKYLIIPQFYSEKKFRESHPEDCIVSMNTNDYKYVINQILSSDIIYSSSLHGIILAEAYGIPAVFFRGLAPKIDFKYIDYYYSTGRDNVSLPDTFEEALQTTPPPLPDLTGLCDGLLKSFPYDLWDNKK